MNVLFVYSCSEIQSFHKPLGAFDKIQLGISYISAVLKGHGHQTRCCVLSRLFGGKNVKRLSRYIALFKPGLICFTAVQSEYQFVSRMATFVKETYPHIYTLLGGTYASLNPEEAMAGDFDALCIGEGEYPTLELVQQLEAGKVPTAIANLWFKRGADIERNNPRAFLQELDRLPFLDRAMWQEFVDEELHARTTVLLGRGCPFECTYCSNHALKKIAPGKYVRFRSPENIVRELEEITQQYPGRKEVYLEVESFGVNKAWARTLCRQLTALNQRLSQPLCFGANLRIIPGETFEWLFQECRRANFTSINIGLESGSEQVRRVILNRNYTNDDMYNTVQAARRDGLRVHFYNLIGLPGESLGDLRETIRLNRLCQPDKNYTSIFFPYKGTRLYEVCREQKLMRVSKPGDMERRKSMLRLPGVSVRTLRRYMILFDYYVYKGKKPLYKIGAHIVARYLFSMPRVNYLFRSFVRLPGVRRLKYFLERY